MMRVRRKLRAWRRALSWADVAPIDATTMRVRIRTWHPAFWLAVARELWRSTLLTFRVWRWSFSVGGARR